MTHRCSDSELQAIASALELVFHRDFGLTLFGKYPIAYLKTSKTQRHAKKTHKNKVDEEKEEEKIVKLFDNKAHFPLAHALDIADENMTAKKTTKREDNNTHKNITKHSRHVKHIRKENLVHAHDENFKSTAANNTSLIGKENGKNEIESCNNEKVSEYVGMGCFDNSVSIANESPSSKIESTLNESELPIIGNETALELPSLRHESSSCDKLKDKDQASMNKIHENGQLLPTDSAMNSTGSMIQYADQLTQNTLNLAAQQLTEIYQSSQNDSLETSENPSAALKSKKKVHKKISEQLNAPLQQAVTTGSINLENIYDLPRNTATLHHNPWNAHNKYPWFLNKQNINSNNKSNSAVTKSSPPLPQSYGKFEELFHLNMCACSIN